MKLTTSILLVIILFCGCTRNNSSGNANHADSSHTDTAVQKPVSANQPSAEAYLALFTPANKDTLFVKPPESSDEKSLFAGKKIDSRYYKYIGHSDTTMARDGYFFYACYQFPVNERVVGLVLRGPGMYWENSMRLFLFDKQLQRSIASEEIALSWGDAGDSFEKYAYLFRNKNTYRVAVYQRFCWPKDDSMERFDCADSTFNYQVSNNIKAINKLAEPNKELVNGRLVTKRNPWK